jgi:hypothetical protein
MTDLTRQNSPARILKELCRKQDGVVLPYVAVTVALMVGITGFALDTGRLTSTHSDAQAAANAAALAAASQLDGGTVAPNAIERATNAAVTTPLVSNQHVFAEGENDILIVGIRFLSDLPNRDDNPNLDPFVTTDPAQARFVEVTTATLNQENVLVAVLGGPSTSTIQTTAVAGNTQVLCRIPPLWVCLPDDFDAELYKGRQVLAKAAGPNSSWDNGNFGLLTTPSGESGAGAIADMLASADPNSGCYAAEVETAPGQKQGVREALNTRFDMYSQPGYPLRPIQTKQGVTTYYPPAPNVTSLYSWNGKTNNQCDWTPPATSPTVPLNRDVDISGGNRFGSGYWNCRTYWETTHGSGAVPAGCENNSNALTRWEIYHKELDLLASNALTSSTVDTPHCYSAGTVGYPAAPAPSAERRILYMVGVNCNGESLSGRSTIPFGDAKFIKAFITEPVGDSGGGSSSEIYLEILDVVSPGSDDGVLHDLVQLYRR